MNKWINTFYGTTIYAIASIRGLFWGLFLKKIGNNVFIMSRITLMSPQKIEIGNNVLINSGTIIGGQEGISIGNDVLIGYNVNIVSQNHSFKNPKVLIRKQGYYGKKVIIEDDVWIGANAVILPGVKIGKGSVIGANAVVTKSVKPFSVMGGIPAKFIKSRTLKN